MTHPEIEAEQSHIDRAHLLLEQARVRALKLRGMVEVGRGRMTMDDFKLFMDGGHPELAVVRAPAHGLYLAEVSYA